ncbi:FHA domain-containing protein, partial [Falsiroseomonas sp. CW058]|uniref:FHA domain-containing protein n=1 Tax=Falsiroseomonas sp. CW058 TaxID=3388664 RepID=UPI003D315D21
MGEITLSVLRCPDNVVPEERRATGGEISLGRGAECDWQLADPDRVLSKRHCVVEFFGGGWQLRDTSTNGTFVNHGAAPVGRDQVRPLLDGDRLRLGAYEIEVRIAEATAPGAGWGGGPAAPAADPFGASAPQGFGTPQGFGAQPGFGGALPGMGTPPGAGGGLLPDDFDPFGDDAAPMPDHAPSTAEAFMVPPSLPAGKAVIPDDWDLDLNPASAPAPQPAPRLAPLPPQAPPAAGGPAFAASPDPFAPPSATPGPSAAPWAAPLPAVPDLPDPFAEHGDPLVRPQPV